MSNEHTPAATSQAGSNREAHGMRAASRIVYVEGTTSKCMDGDVCHEAPGPGTLPVLLEKGWRVTAVLPIGDGSTGYWFLAPPAGAPDGFAP